MNNDRMQSSSFVKCKTSKGLHVRAIDVSLNRTSQVQLRCSMDMPEARQERWISLYNYNQSSSSKEFGETTGLGALTSSLSKREKNRYESL